MKAIISTTRRLIILGGGYTARMIYEVRRTQRAQVTVSSRNPDRHLAYTDPEDRLRFDLQQPDTWTTIPTETDLLWCFPAEPLEHVAAFARMAQLAVRRLVVLGSTSAYDVGRFNEYPPPWVDEAAPINMERPRVQGEEWLRTQCGAIVLRVAGIYGPGRSPVEWIRQGRVTASRKYVNLIHVEDLAAVCLAAIERGRRGEAYNVSDGTPRTWASICQAARERWGIDSSAPSTEQEVGKRVKTTKLRSELKTELRYLDLYSALEELESRPPKSFN